MTDLDRTSSAPADPAWRVVAERELADLWLTGRGLPLMLAYTVLLSVSGYLVATNLDLNFLEQRESVGLILQVAVAVGSLLVLLGAADTVSGERERGTLESLLLSPAPRLGLAVGKAVGALSLWVAAVVLALPYVWFMGRGVDIVGVALLSGLLVGTLLALFLAGLGLLVSILAESNRLSLSVSIFVLLALYAPTQLPTSAQNGWAGQLLLHADPFTAGLRYISLVVVEGRNPLGQLNWLLGPAIAALLACVAAVLAAGRLELKGGERA